MRCIHIVLFGVVGLFGAVIVDGSEWIRVGPDAGMVTALATHPTDPEIAFAGTEDGGIFRTSDGGDTWSSVGLRGFGITVIRFSVSDPSYVYAGLDRWSQDEQIPGGVFVSDDGGLSWKAAREGLEDFLYPPDLGWYRYQEINDLAVDPTDPATVWVATPDGAFVTTNGGNSWSKVPWFGPYRLAVMTVVSGSPLEIYASWPHHGVVRSADGGETWSDASEGLVLPSHNGNPLLYSPDEMFEAPWTPDVVFGRVGSYHLVRYDATENAWSRVESLDSVPRRGAWQGRWFTDVASGPEGSQDLWMGTVWNGVIRSIDGGTSWFNTDSAGLECEDVVAGRGSFLEIPELAVFAGSGDHVIASTVARSIVRSLDGGSTWHPASEGLSNSNPLSVFIEENHPEIMITSTRGQGLFHTSDGGETWEEVLSREVFPCDYWGPNPWAFPPPDCWSWGEVLREPNGSLLVDGGCGTYVSSDRGASWQEAGEEDLWPLGGSDDDGLWYVHDSQGQFLRGDGGDGNWQACEELPSAPYPERLIEGVVFHGSEPDVALVGRYGDLFRTEDGCQSWTSTGEAFAECRIYWLGADPDRPERFLVSTGCGLWESNDRGITWREIDGSQMTFRELIFDPDRPDVVYARTTYDGIHYSTDRGVSWRLLGFAPNELPTTDIVLDPDGSALLVAAYGDGVYRLTLPSRFDRVRHASQQ